jgi:hypothetical protein
MHEEDKVPMRTSGSGVVRHMTPIERLPIQIRDAESRLERLKRLEELLEKNPDLREALDIVFSGGIL